MNQLFIYLSVLFLSLSIVASSQEVVSVRKKDFKAGKEGFSEAWKHVGRGDDLYLLGGAGYGTALQEYLHAWNYNNANAELNYKMGVCALFSDNREKAYDYLQKALQLKENVARDILLLTGHSLQYRGDFTGAAALLNKYLDSDVKKSDTQVRFAKQYLEECISARKIMADTLKVIVTDEGSNINSSSDDYSEIITSDGTFMCFASRRPVSEKSTHYRDGKSDENIFVASVQDDSWGAAQLLDKGLTTRLCETPLCFTRSSDSLFIYVGYQGNGDVRLSVKKKNGWSTPSGIRQHINSKYHESSFCLSPSGDEAYFVSDRKKDNMGGKDIYIIKKNSKGKWSSPQNAGNILNTQYDEESVRLSDSGDTLWFSSRGHDSIGGYDIFYAVKNQSGEWDNVRNAGYPVNTPWDELFYLPSPGEPDVFYFSSDRPGGLGGLDIYKAHRFKSGLSVKTTPAIVQSNQH